MISRLAFAIIVLATVLLGVLRFSVGMQGVWVDGAFLTLAVASIILGVRQWAYLLGSIRSRASGSWQEDARQGDWASDRSRGEPRGREAREQ